MAVCLFLFTVKCKKARYHRVAVPLTNSSTIHDKENCTGFNKEKSSFLSMLSLHLLGVALLQCLLG